MGSFSEYLNLDTLKSLKNLEIKARLIVEGFLTGLHRSPYKGFSLEFSEHRQYFPGDPLKNVDWKVYARSEKLFIKKFEEETNLKAYIILDGSRSMDYGEKLTKFEYGAYLAASLSYLLILQKDAVGISLFNDRLRLTIPPRGNKEHLKNLIAGIVNFAPVGKTDISKTIYDIAPTIKRRGLIIIISDLLDDQKKTRRAIKALRAKKNEVIVFHILDRDEVEFSFNKSALFIDLESNKKVPVEPVAIKRFYKDAMQRFIIDYRNSFLEDNVDYVNIITDEPFDKALYRYLSKRSRML